MFDLGLQNNFMLIFNTKLLEQLFVGHLLEIQNLESDTTQLYQGPEFNNLG